MTTTIEADFREDARAHLLAELDAARFDVPSDVVADVEDVARFYFNIRWKMLSPRRRRVHRSRQLVARARTLAPATRQVVNAIERKSVAGEPLAPFLSERLTRMPDYDDPLLNEWGIHHLHLGGSQPRANGYVPRSGELLFVYAKADDLYLLDVCNHQSFLDDELVDVIHTNWQHVIEPFRAVGFTVDKEDDAATPEMRRMARRSGLSMLTRVADGTVYVAPGGGYMSNRLSARVLRQSDSFLEFIEGVEASCRTRAPELAGAISSKRGAPLLALHLNLRFDDGPSRMSVIETQTRHVFPVELPRS